MPYLILVTIRTPLLIVSSNVIRMLLAIPAKVERASIQCMVVHEECFADANFLT